MRSSSSTDIQRMYCTPQVLPSSLVWTAQLKFYCHLEDGLHTSSSTVIRSTDCTAQVLPSSRGRTAHLNIYRHPEDRLHTSNSTVIRRTDCTPQYLPLSGGWMQIKCYRSAVWSLFLVIQLCYFCDTYCNPEQKLQLYEYMGHFTYCTEMFYNLQCFFD